jgi:hypothetical protein
MAKKGEPLVPRKALVSYVPIAIELNFTKGFNKDKGGAYIFCFKSRGVAPFFILFRMIVANGTVV